MKKFNYKILILLPLFTSCNKEEVSNDQAESAFRNVERELGITRPLSEEGLKAIQKHYGSAEKYKEQVLKNRAIANERRIAEEESLKARFGIVSKVYLETPEGSTYFYHWLWDSYILDSAEESGIELPYSCRAGACYACAGKVISGALTLESGISTVYEDSDLMKGFYPLCVAYPAADPLKILTHQENEVAR